MYERTGSGPVSVFEAMIPPKNEDSMRALRLREGKRGMSWNIDRLTVAERWMKGPETFSSVHDDAIYLHQTGASVALQICPTRPMNFLRSNWLLRSVRYIGTPTQKTMATTTEAAAADWQSTSAAAPISKPVHTIILDSSPVLLNIPSLSTLLAQCETLSTTPSVIAEIIDPIARSRVETLYLPFVKVRSPKQESINFVKEFAKKTGDATVLSETDVGLLALAYDIECERNGGDWRLRKTPGHKRVNGSPPKKDIAPAGEISNNGQTEPESAEVVTEELDGLHLDEGVSKQSEMKESNESPQNEDNKLAELDTLPQELETQESDSGAESEGWITPSNIKKHQARDENASTSTKSEPKTLQAATMTGDFAMQNVLLQMNLNLLSPRTCKRISHLKQTILRCHGCFLTTKDMTKQFCPRCGKPTLTRVSCTTNDQGEVKLHLKANMQWNNKGNVFSIPKPVSGTSNQKWQGPRHGGGGQGGWGQGLVLAEDQKEYIRAMTSGGRRKDKDLMDEDFLPSILTGDRNRAGGRPKVGAGRNVNAKKR